MDEEKKELPESELLKIQREKYEAIIKDKNKIIAELLNQTAEPKKNNKQDEENDEADEEKAKKDEEARKQKRAEYYKKHIF